MHQSGLHQLKALRALAGAVVVVFFAVSPAPGADPIKIGFLAPMTGLFAQAGKDMLDGLKMGLEVSGGQVAGRKLELIDEDTEGNPATAQAKYRKLVQQDKINVLTGVLLANIGYALIQPIERDELPSLFFTTPDELTKRKPSKWILRANFAASQPMHALGDYAAKVLKYKRVAALGMDNPFGHEQLGGFQRVFEDAGGRVVQKTWVPLNAMDFAPYLGQVPPDVDAVVQVFIAGQAVRFAKQYEETGLKDKLPLIGTGVYIDESALRSMGDEAIGTVGALVWAPTLTEPGQPDLHEAGRGAGQAHAGVLPRRHVQRRALDRRGGEGRRRQGRRPRALPGGDPQGERDHRGPARADQARRVQQPHRERVHPEGREGGRTAAEHRDPHLSDGLAVLDLQAGGLLESSRLRPELPAGEAMSGVRQVGYFDCAGGGQVVVSGTTAYVAHMKAPHGTTIVDVSDPARPRAIAELTIPRRRALAQGARGERRDAGQLGGRAAQPAGSGFSRRARHLGRQHAGPPARDHLLALPTACIASPSTAATPTSRPTSTATSATSCMTLDLEESGAARRGRALVDARAVDRRRRDADVEGPRPSLPSPDPPAATASTSRTGTAAS